MDKYLLLKQLFEQHEDIENARKMAKYMRNLFKFYGIATPKRKGIYRDILKQEKANKKLIGSF